MGNFNITLNASGMFVAGVNIQYLCTLLPGEALRQFDMLSAEVGVTNPEILTSVILGLGTYCFLLILCQK